MGRATRPFKFGDAKEFDKWLHLENSLPIRAVATFEMAAASQEATKMMLVEIRPVQQVKPTVTSPPIAAKV